MEEIVFHPEARVELFDAANYYETCRPGLGQEFLAMAEATSSFIHTRPFVGQIIRPPYRRFLIKQFPYGIIYRRLRTVTYIVAIMHLKRKPGYWRLRTQKNA